MTGQNQPHTPDDSAEEFSAGGLAEMQAILNDAEAVYYDDGPPREYPPLDKVAAIDQKLCRYSATDLGNAERLVARHGADLIWIKEIGWVCWTGKRWDRERGDTEVQLRAHDTARAIRNEVLAMGALGPYEEETPKAFDERMEKFAKFAKDSKNQRRLGAITTIAGPILHGMNDDLDRHHFLFNTESGTINLQAKDTGDGSYNGGIALRKHQREDRLTRLSPIKYDPDAQCPRFLQFLRDIQPDDDIQLFLQRFFGYCLSGSIREQIVVMFYGQGSNGKSTLMDLMNYVMGDYALVLPFASLLQDDRRRGSEATPDLARLPGARFVTSAEPETGARFSEATLKTLTGGEKMTVRHLNKGFFEFYPQFKLCLSFNNKPAIRGQDDGIWRRIVLVPFDQKFVDQEKLAEFPRAKLKDRSLEGALREEAAGIFNWILDGYRLWVESGLQIPARIRAATEEYKTESNPVNQFLLACTRRREGGYVQATRLYEAYKLWCQDNALDPMSQTKFGYRMKDSGIEKSRGEYITYTGIELNLDVETRLDEAAARKFHNRGGNDD
ncbi:MAG: phage/plasmid primase, P4 family [Micavibrio sp.]